MSKARLPCRNKVFCSLNATSRLVLQFFIPVFKEIEIISFKATEFREFSAASEIKGVCQGIASNEGRKIGEALEAYYKNFQGVKTKKADFKMALFLVVKGATIGKVELLKKYGEMYKQLGVTIYIIGIGSSINIDQMKLITDMSLIYQAKTYASVMTEED